MKQSNVKQEAHHLIDQLPEDTTWDKVLYAIQVHKDIAEGISDIEAGHVIDGDKVMEWLESWGTEQEKEPPTL